MGLQLIVIKTVSTSTNQLKMKRVCNARQLCQAAIFLASLFIFSQSGFAQCTTCTITNPAVLPDPIPTGTTICITTDQTYGGGANLTGGAIHVCSGAILRINGAVTLNATSEITTIDCSRVEVDGNIHNDNPIGLKVIDECDCPDAIRPTGPIFGFGVVCGPLPVELVYFETRLENENEIKIDWATATEINNDYFTIERSTDVQNWDLITTVDGAGNSNQLIRYSSTDVLNDVGTYYYRLTQVDYDGQSETFDYRTVTCNSIQPIVEVSVFPNPASEFVTLSMNGNVTDELRADIMNLSGQVVSTSFIAKGSSREQRLSLDGFEKGIYIVKVSGGSLNQSSKLVIR